MEPIFSVAPARPLSGRDIGRSWSNSFHRGPPARAHMASTVSTIPALYHRRQRMTDEHRDPRYLADARATASRHGLDAARPHHGGLS